MKIHSRLLTQTQLVALLDNLKQVGILDIADADIKEHVETWSELDRKYKPIKSSIPVLRARAKAEVSKDEIVIEDLIRYKCETNTALHYRINVELQTVLNELKKFKSRD